MLPALSALPGLKCCTTLLLFGGPHHGPAVRRLIPGRTISRLACTTASQSRKSSHNFACMSSKYRSANVQYCIGGLLGRRTFSQELLEHLLPQKRALIASWPVASPSRNHGAAYCGKFGLQNHLEYQQHCYIVDIRLSTQSTSSLAWQKR